MDMRADDSLPKMALFFALAVSAFGVAGGGGLGWAFFGFLILTLFAPLLALLLAYLLTKFFRRPEALRLYATWILAVTGTLWAASAALRWALA
jgi:hypothetical protein